MSVSCVGTCTNCGVRRFWLSDTMSLQLDDGRLKCLRHPAERYDCEKEGLTLAQASERGRLFCETFYVCRNCGKEGETFKKIEKFVTYELNTFSARDVIKWCWGSAALLIPFLAWMRWWDAAVTIGGTLVIAPAVFWWEERKPDKPVAARGLPRDDGPGRISIAEPVAGSIGEKLVGHKALDHDGKMRATGPCCDHPDWIEAFAVKDEYRVPCYACGKGLMVVSEHSIH